VLKVELWLWEVLSYIFVRYIINIIWDYIFWLDITKANYKKFVQITLEKLSIKKNIEEKGTKEDYPVFDKDGFSRMH